MLTRNSVAQEEEQNFSDFALLARAKYARVRHYVAFQDLFNVSLPPSPPSRRTRPISFSLSFRLHREQFGRPWLGREQCFPACPEYSYYANSDEKPDGDPVKREEGRGVEDQEVTKAQDTRKILFICR